MLEVGWSELLVIAIILIVVVGPKDLPGMMRTFGRVMGRVRTMANEFRGQFDEAMREADLDDVRKTIGEANKYNPANTIRDAINPIRQLGQDIKTDLQKTSVAATKTADGGTPIGEPASDPVVDPAPAKADPAPHKPVSSASAPVEAAVAREPVAVAKPATKPARAKKAPESEDKPVAKPARKPSTAAKATPKKKTAKTGDA